MLEVTAKVISFLTVYYVLLAAKVIRLRLQHKVSLGDGSLQFIIGTVLPAILKENEDSSNTTPANSSNPPTTSSSMMITRDNKYSSLQKAIRAHSNLAEYGPWTILLFLVCELRESIPLGWLHAMATIFIVARVLHVEFGMKASAALGFGRTLGMALTFTIMMTLAFSLLIPILSQTVAIYIPENFLKSSSFFVQ